MLTLWISSGEPIREVEIVVGKRDVINVVFGLFCSFGGEVKVLVGDLLPLV